MAVLDEEALLATSTYIDLNPVAAKVAEVPETSKHTSIKKRVDHIKARARRRSSKRPKAGSVAGSYAAGGLEDGQWLCPIEDRRRLDSSRPGMFEGLSIGSYLLLVDYTGRLFREGKASDIGGAGRYSRSDWQQCRELAGPDGKAQERPIVRPFLRGQPG